MMTESKKQKKEDKYTKWEKQLRDAIERSGMTKYEIAKRSGVDCSQLYRFLKVKGGRKKIAFRTAEKIAKVLGMELKSKKSRRK